MEILSEQLKRVQQVDQIAKNTLKRQEEKMPEKYANIEATLKLLFNLISSFRKRADVYEQQLKQRAKISDLTDQIRLHRSRISDCQRLSHSLQIKLEKKKEKIQIEEKRIKKLRAQLLTLKTQNVKKILKLEELQENHQAKQEKEIKQTRKASWRMKTENFREQIQTNFSRAQSNSGIQKRDLNKKLHQILERKVKLHHLVQEIWRILKDKLVKQQRKTTINGLNGSLIFKVLENDKPCPPKALNDPKLMIYDVLKNKYKVNKKEMKNSEMTVSQQEFMNYSGIQVLGMIELRGGLQKLRQNINSYEKSLRGSIKAYKTSQQ